MPDEGVSLPADSLVFRLCRATNTGEMAPEAFELSSKDKAQAIPRLSVWEESRTTHVQAIQLSGNRYDMAGHLPVGRIQEVRPDPEDPDAANLDVQWELARDESGAPIALAGAEGHSGITGLAQVEALTKPQRKSLRAKLARIANATRVVKL